MPDHADERKAALAEYEALYARFRAFFENEGGFDEGWAARPEFQRLLFNLEIRKNLEKAKLEVEFKLKDMAREIEVLKHTRKSFGIEEPVAQTLCKDEPRVRDHKKLYAQQKLVRQKNLINRLKLSLLNIYKNVQVNEAEMKSDAYLSLPQEVVGSACDKFLSQCIFEKLIFDNISEQFKGKVNLESVKQMLEHNRATIMKHNKENGIIAYGLNVNGADNNSFVSGSDSLAKIDTEN